MRRESWLPAVPESAAHARAVIRELGAALRLDGETTWELALATTEAFANAVEHGVPCPRRGILLRVEGSGDSVGVEICDCGGAFRDRRSRKPDGQGGRGIALIEAVTDLVEITPADDTTRVRFEKQLAAA